MEKVMSLFDWFRTTLQNKNIFGVKNTDNLDVESTTAVLEDNDNLSVYPEYCDPCKLLDKSSIAVKLCNDCEEKLCISCGNQHAFRTATSSHTLFSLEERNKTGRFLCTPCSDDENAATAVTLCKECEEHLCEKCTFLHKKRRATRLHVLTEIDQLPSKFEETEEDKATLSNDLISTEKGVKNRSGDFRKQNQKIRDLEADVHANITRDSNSEKIRPGKPTSSDVFADSIKLSWEPPFKYGDDDYYQISFKDLDHEKKWKFIPGEFRSSTVVLTDFKSKNSYVFRVRVVYEDGEGPYSQESNIVVTSDSPASRVVKFSQMVERGDPLPTIYALPVTEIREARNESAKTKKFEFGAPPHQEGKSKTIVLVGATGTGKSTLVDGIVNYVLGVNWDDPFRFTVLDLEQEEKVKVKNQALSQTEWITCYTLNPEIGSRLQYQLNIIDTPGFGDTRGLKRDQEIVEQIRQLFSERHPKGVTFIDAVCFLVKAPDARLTANQSYIFQSVMSLFGKDIEKNICSLVTFADGIDPPVLAALRASGLPFGNSFTFNNSGLFARNVNLSEASLSPMLWDMGLKSFRAFFDHLDQIETKSLQLTKNVLDERSRLEATIKNLQPQLDAGLMKVNSLKQEIKIIDENESLIKNNKNFEYEVSETRQRRKDLPRGQHVTNCINCHFTCHDNCAYANNEEKAKCSAMGSDGRCRICPDRCHWRRHANTPYIFEYVTVNVKKTYADMQRKYQEATGKLLTQEQIVEKLGEELCDLLDVTEDMMFIIKECNQRLAEIALRPNPLSMTEHIDLMIENEKLEKKDGFLQRINILNDFRRRALLPNEFEKLKKAATSTLGAVGKKKNCDTKSVLTRIGAWLMK